MKLAIILEGIETKEQLDFLKSCAAGKGQGYYFSNPLSADEIAKLLRDYGKV